jgi:hypothetical protein
MTHLKFREQLVRDLCEKCDVPRGRPSSSDTQMCRPKEKSQLNKQRKKHITARNVEAHGILPKNYKTFLKI